MPDSKVSATITKRTPDYTGNRQHATELAKRVQDYYHAQGHTNIRCWVEPEFSTFGRKLWGVRSNIVFNFANA